MMGSQVEYELISAITNGTSLKTEYESSMAAVIVILLLWD